MARIILSRGHSGTGGQPAATYGGLDEGRLTRVYMGAIEDVLCKAGHEVIVISGFPYTARHRRAKDLGADVYLACHINATHPNTTLDTPSRAMVAHDHRSTRGAKLARAIAAQLETTRGNDSRVFSANPDNWTDGMYHVISGVYSGKPVGCTLEPLYIDRVDDEIWRTEPGLRLIGRAIAQGVLDFLNA